MRFLLLLAGALLFAARTGAQETPAAGVTYAPLPNGSVQTVAGVQVQAQCGTANAIRLSSDGVLNIQARANKVGSAWEGERADFDKDVPRKVRAELSVVRRYEKGEPMHFKARIFVEPDSMFAGSSWNSIVQIHQADTRYAGGWPVTASPIFGIELRQDGEGAIVLEVGGETDSGLMRKVVTDPKTSYFASLRKLGSLPNFTLGAWHDLEYIVVDGHGGPGRISVWVDRAVVCDRSDINTGYSYVDTLSSAYLVRGKPQPASSYIKFGIYAGLGSGPSAPAGFRMGIRYKDISFQ